uniref:Uncharacterized protein n=1 Tax=mine drainage metagenome TaxID=410659 RepID=E6Q4G4_9ZZZZ
MNRFAFVSAAAAGALAASTKPVSALALSDLTGDWESTASGEGSCGDSVGHFKLTLTQAGGSVTGSYYGGTASLSGTLAGNVLLGTWKESDGTGSLRFIFSDDRKSFEGSWSIPGSRSMGGWSGERSS